MGPILEVEVEFNQNFSNPSVVFMIDSIYAEDYSANPLVAVADDFGQFSGDMVSVDYDNALPSDFVLHSNYPNPFNPSTIISYSIPENTDVALNIYDMRGRMIKSLVNQNQAAGRYLVEWNATDDYGSNVGAGVYIYQLRSRNKTFSQKMVLMK